MIEKRFYIEYSNKGKIQCRDVTEVQMRELFTYIMRGDMKKLFWEQSDNVMIQFFRYVFVGGVAFLVDGGSLFLLEWMGMHYLLAAVFAFIFGLLANFILSKIFVFRGNESKKGNVVEFLIYGGIGAVGLGITELILYGLTEQLHIYFMISKVIAAAVVLVWNFVARKLILY